MEIILYTFHVSHFSPISSWLSHFPIFAHWFQNLEEPFFYSTSVFYSSDMLFCYPYCHKYELNVKHTLLKKKELFHLGSKEHIQILYLKYYHLAMLIFFFLLSSLSSHEERDIDIFLLFVEEIKFFSKREEEKFLYYWCFP